MPSSVYLSFGSAQQKSTFFRIMANRIRFGNDAARRDVFPKALIPEAKRLAQRGMELRINGEVVSFKVVGGRKKTGRMETEGVTGRPRIRGTLSKMFGVSGKLSVPQPGTNPPQQRKDEMGSRLNHPFL